MPNIPLERKQKFLSSVFQKGTPCFFALASALACPAIANADNKHAAPVPRPAPAFHAPAMGGAAAPHFPGGMGPAAHVPGNMNAAHLPASMVTGGAHLPSSMGASSAAHIPSGMNAGVHVPGANIANPRNIAAMAHAGRPAPLPGGRAAPMREAGVHGPEQHANDHGFAERSIDGQRHEEIAHSRVEDGREEHGRQERDPHNARHEIAGFMHPQEHRDFGHEREMVAMHGHDFHARYFRDFSPYERARWRGGYWHNDWHYGRFGWWWNVGDVWYPYADPVFPYPLEVVQPVIYETQVMASPDPEPAEAAALADRNIPLLPAPPPGRYSCASPAGYFPDVDSCRGPWQFADAAPPAAQP